MSMLYPFYEPAESEVEELLASVSLGRLITYGAPGLDVGLFPFVRTSTGVEIHMNKSDPQLAALIANPSVAFQVDDVLSRIPSDWVDPQIATYADALYRSVTFFGAARVTDDENRLIAHLEGLLRNHQGDERHAPLKANRNLYASALSRIRLISITEERRQTKFKLGQQESEAIRGKVIEKLRERGSATDLRTVAHVERILNAPAG